MRFMVLLLIGAAISGCTARYQRVTVMEPTKELDPQKSVAISTPASGSYGEEDYPKSGHMTAGAVRLAFERHSREVWISEDCRDLECLKGGKRAGYYVVPEILRWEDHILAWGGTPDRMEVKLTIYEDKSWERLASAVISGKSRWLTFGAERPQHLLPEPLTRYVRMLYGVVPEEEESSEPDEASKKEE